MLYATYGPRSGGDGYLVAPLKGKDSPIFEHIAIQAEMKSIPHEDAQAIIWAVRAQDYEYILKHPQAKDLLKPEHLLYMKAQEGKSNIIQALTAKIDESLPPEIKQMLDLRKK